MTVKLDGEDRTVVGNASDTDTVLSASCVAYVTAVNKLIEKSKRTAPDAMASESVLFTSFEKGGGFATLFCALFIARHRFCLV